MARTADVASRRSYFSSGTRFIGVNIVGDEFSGSLWFARDGVETLVDYEGSVDILNEGIFVVNEPTTEWFPEFGAFCDGVLNFSSKAISLPAGRDRVIKNDQFRSRRSELAEKSFLLVDELVTHTQISESERDYAAQVLAHIYKEADKTEKERLLKRLPPYRVKFFKQEGATSLGDLKNGNSSELYIQYNKGTWVEDLTLFDKKQLYHKEDDRTELQAAMMVQDGKIVIATVRIDLHRKKADSVLEADLIKAFFSDSRTEIIDLTEKIILEGKYRSMPVPGSVRREVGAGTKFVEVSGLPNKRGWKVGNELWVNLANPTMRQVYDALQKSPDDDITLRLISILFDIISYRFDEAVQKTAGLICRTEID